MGIPRKVSDLGELSDAEKRVLAELDSGETTVLGDGKRPEAGDQARKVQAGLIRILLLGHDPKHRHHEKGVRIAGAWIPDLLDLEGCVIPCDIGLVCCFFGISPVLRSASVALLNLNGSVFPSLTADGLEATRDVFLRDAKVSGTVRLPGAKLGGSLNCDGAKFWAEKDAEGKPGNALIADRLEAGGGVFLRGVEAAGEVRLLGARLGGDLDCVGAKLRAGKDAEGKRGDALSADGLEAKGYVFLRGVEVAGTVRLLGARLGQSLECDGARFRADKDAMGKLGNALFADGLEVRGGVFMRGVEATGAVRLLGAKLGGSLECDGAIFWVQKEATGSLGNALCADGLEAGGNVFLNGVEMTGRLVMPGARIDGNLDFRWARDDVGSGILADLRGSQIGGVFHMPATARPGGGLVLSGAHARVIDGGPRALAAPEKVWLNRFEYDGLVGDAVNVPVEDWLAFLAKQFRPDDPADFYPQPYEQLAKVLREAGHGEDARAVLIEKERRQRAARLRRAPLETRARLRLSDRVLWHTVRHGRQPLRAALWLGVFWAIGTVIFFSASDSGAIKPNNAFMLRQTAWTECAPLEGRARLACFEAKAPSYPEFNALIYSADTLLPIVSLEMQGYWIPDDSQGVGWLARGYLWIHIAVGWALSLLAVAGFSGLVKSD